MFLIRFGMALIDVGFIFSAEPESKKKKNDKKAQNGGITTQTKQKDRKQKKASKGFFEKR